MTAADSSEITRLIEAARGEDEVAYQRLWDRVYTQILEIARGQRFVGRTGETLEPGALAHELLEQFQRRFPAPPRDQPESRATFFRSASQAMRTILRDHYRSRMARLGREERHARDEAERNQVTVRTQEIEKWLRAEAVLDGLEAVSSEAWQVAQLRIAFGWTVKRTADELGMSPATVKRRLALATLWMRQELGDDDA